jgi:glutamyl/glutaminyl-tRNA synthetase
MNNNITKARLAKLITNISKDFELSKISKSPARFNTEKLSWFNREYIKMMGLEEFVQRSFQLKLSRQFPDSKLRIGDHVYLVDIEKQMVYCETQGTLPGIEQPLHPIGGGRPEGLTSIENLLKEVEEETNNQIQIDESKLIKVVEYVLDGQFIKALKPSGLDYTAEEALTLKDHPKYFDGKHLTIYFYPVKTTEITKFEERDAEDGRLNHFGWVKMEDLIGYNRLMTYPIWKEFCRNNGIECFGVTDRIRTQYKAWTLDKNRANLLTDLGSESDCILSYTKPTTQELKWKKITEEESLANLDSIKEYINEVWEEFQELYIDLNNSKFNDYPAKLGIISAKWETTLKSWLTSNGFDAGSYFWPLRVCLSGKAKSPSPFELLAVLDLDEVNRRVDGCLE